MRKKNKGATKRSKQLPGEGKSTAERDANSTKGIGHKTWSKLANTSPNMASLVN